MNFPISFLLNAGGLFDFDLTFVAEGTLFLFLALIVTFVFVSPVAKQLDERAEFINYTLRKATILLTFGYEKLVGCVGLLTEEIGEMNRQIKLTKNYTNSNFETEILFILCAETKTTATSRNAEINIFFITKFLLMVVIVKLSMFNFRHFYFQPRKLFTVKTNKY
jgi:hypothetical protein